MKPLFRPNELTQHPGFYTMRRRHGVPERPFWRVDKLNRIDHTFDGRNPAHRQSIPLSSRFYTSQVVQDLFINFSGAFYGPWDKSPSFTTIWDDIFGVLSKHFQVANPSSSDSSSRSKIFVIFFCVGSSRPGFSKKNVRRK